MLVTNFYTGLNEILKAVTGEELSQLEVEVLKFLVGWSYWRHLTLEHFTFTPKYIAKQLHAKKNGITKAIEKLKRLGLLEDCNSYADSVLREKLYQLCEQYAKTESKLMTFFYR